VSGGGFVREGSVRGMGGERDHDTVDDGGGVYASEGDRAQGFEV